MDLVSFSGHVPHAVTISASDKLESVSNAKSNEKMAVRNFSNHVTTIFENFKQSEESLNKVWA